MTLSSATTPGQSEPGSVGNDGVLHITQSSKTGASPSDCVEPYPGHSLRGSYPTVGTQLVYSTVPAVWSAIQS